MTKIIETSDDPILAEIRAWYAPPLREPEPAKPSRVLPPFPAAAYRALTDGARAAGC